MYIPITETFNAFEGVLATPGSNEIGLQIRRMCLIQGVNSWIVADPATKAAVVQAVQMDDLVHKAKLYRTNWHYKHFLKEYIFLDRCVWKRFGRTSSYIFWMNVYGKYLGRLLVCIFFDSYTWITI
ncbi:unnamed protein product [Camellia sinensis]